MTVATAVAGGCGGGEDTHSTSEVIDLFQERTGDRLTRHSDGRLDYETLDFAETDEETGWVVDTGLHYEKYGAFTIYVADDDEAAEGILEDYEGKDVRPATSDGIYWVRQTFSDRPSWGVYKRYGNVVLHWQAERRKKTNKTFERLDSILRGLEA